VACGIVFTVKVSEGLDIKGYRRLSGLWFLVLAQRRRWERAPAFKIALPPR